MTDDVTIRPACQADLAAHKQPAVGFWVRFWAGGLDLTLVTVVVAAAARLGVVLDCYLPIELTVLLVCPTYTVIAHRWRGQTVGKWACGLAVTGIKGEVAGLGRIVLRETFGKLLSAIPLGAGFLWSGISRHKRAWHDYIAGTIVTSRPLPLGRWGRAAVAFAVIGIIIVALDVPGLVVIGRDFVAMKPAKPAALPFEGRDPASLVEASSLDESQVDSYSKWLGDNAVAPMDYVVTKAQQHQLLILGELHEKKEALDFLNDLIPRLYHGAGVTKVAMEVCLAEDNDLLKRLVTAEEFDRELAIRIARHQPWGLWGFKEYWDVMETVWRLNRAIPPDQKKVLIIGLDSRMDTPSLAMTIGEGENPAKLFCPAWEKLRVVRLPRVLPKVLARDVRWARAIEREIMETSDRAIVWVGAQHTAASPQPVSFCGQRFNRMGALLRQRYGSKVYCIKLHGGYEIPVSLVDPKYRGPEPAIGLKIEQMMQGSGLPAAGFDTHPSPLGRLRDAGSFDYHYEPRRALEDVADGYLYIKPRRKFKQCTWLAGYVTPQMFVANKPFYQAFGKKAGKYLQDAPAVNRLFEEQ